MEAFESVVLEDEPFAERTPTSRSSSAKSSDAGRLPAERPRRGPLTVLSPKGLRKGAAPVVGESRKGGKQRAAELRAREERLAHREQEVATRSTALKHMVEALPDVPLAAGHFQGYTAKEILTASLDTLLHAMAGTTAAAHRAEVDRKAAQLQAREAALEDRMERIRELESWMRNGSTGDLPFPILDKASLRRYVNTPSSGPGRRTNKLYEGQWQAIPLDAAAADGLATARPMLPSRGSDEAGSRPRSVHFGDLGHTDGLGATLRPDPGQGRPLRETAPRAEPSVEAALAMSELQQMYLRLSRLHRAMRTQLERAQTAPTSSLPTRAKSPHAPTSPAAGHSPAAAGATTGHRPSTMPDDAAGALDSLRAVFAASLVQALEKDVQHYGTDYRQLMKSLLDLMGRTYKLFAHQARHRAPPARADGQLARGRPPLPNAPALSDPSSLTISGVVVVKPTVPTSPEMPPKPPLQPRPPNKDALYRSLVSGTNFKTHQATKPAHQMKAGGRLPPIPKRPPPPARVVEKLEFNDLMVGTRIGKAGDAKPARGPAGAAPAASPFRSAVGAAAMQQWHRVAVAPAAPAKANPRAMFLMGGQGMLPPL